MKLAAKHEQETITISVERTGSGYLLQIADRTFEAELVSPNPSLCGLRFSDGRQYLAVHHREELIHRVTINGWTIELELHDPLALRSKKREDQIGGSGRIKAVMPGRVVRILVSPGDHVEKGAGLLILEAMKMENEIVARGSGTVMHVHVEQGQTVESGGDLVTIE